MDIYTTEDNVRLRSTPDLDAENTVRLLSKCTGFTSVEKQGDWWKVDGGFVHESVAQEISNPQHPTGTVPYRSQWDTDANNRVDDCGQTCVGMVAQWWGKNIAINSLPCESDGSGSTGPADLVANFCSVGLAAQQVRLPPQQVPPLPAIALVRYDGFDRQNVQDTKFMGWHWVVLLEQTDHDVVVHDPDFSGGRRAEGAGKHYSLQEWQQAFIPYTGNETDSVIVIGALS